MSTDEWRSSNIEIRGEIQSALKRRPMTRYELQGETGLCFETTKRHLFYLKGLGVVHVKKYKGKDLWFLKK